MRRYTLTELCMVVVTAGFIAFLCDLAPVTN